MPRKRLMLVVSAIAAAAGCSLFSDLEGFSDPGQVAADAAPSGDAGSSTDAEVTPDSGDSSADAGATYRDEVLADAPIAYWPLDDAPGSTIAREIVGGRDGTAVDGTITFGGPAIAGGALQMPDQGGHLEVGDFFDLAGKTAYSIEFWAKPTLVRQFHDVLRKRDALLQGWIVYFHQLDSPTGTVALEQKYPDGGRGAYPGITPVDDRYHHYVFTYDPVLPVASRMRLYFDAVRRDGNSDDGAAKDTDVPLLIADGYVGLLDEIAIYDHALTAERVLAHFQRGSK